LLGALGGAVVFFSSQLGYNPIDTANLYASSVLTLVLIWVYLNISEIQERQVQFDEKQTRLLEYQNRLRTTEFEPELYVTRGEAEDGMLDFVVGNEGIGVAFGLNLLIEGRPGDSFQPQRVNPVLDDPRSDFRGYLRPDDSAHVYFELPDDVVHEYFEENDEGEISITFQIQTTDAGGKPISSDYFQQIRYRPSEHQSLTDCL
jgi:hypothetical protein